jgi:hypothetical protein
MKVEERARWRAQEESRHSFCKSQIRLSKTESEPYVINMQKGAYKKKKKKSFAGQFAAVTAAVEYRSETYC